MPAPLEVAIQAALAAGSLLRRKFQAPREVKSKGWRDIVTDADVAAQALILRRLTQAFPRHAILSEEGRQEADVLAAGPTWVIDPLDGTTNYARQFPSFCVSIALAQQGLARVGVIYNPLSRDLFYARAGRGAFLRRGAAQPERLRVSALNDIAGAVVGVDWPRAVDARQAALDSAARIARASRTLRAVGSTALALAYVSAGWLDGYFHLAFQPWDVAAGVLLVQEAGGQVTTPAGGAWKLNVGHLAASNGRLHPALLQALAG